MAVSVSNLSAPTSVTSGEEFNVSFDGTDLVPGTAYYAKALGGESFTKVDTWNSSWLQQNSAWSGMPVFTSNAVGSISATLKARFEQDTSSGGKEFKVRIKKTDVSGNYDSEIVSISVTAVTPSPSPSPVQSSTASPTSIPSPTKTSTPKPSIHSDFCS